MCACGRPTAAASYCADTYRNVPGPPNTLWATCTSLSRAVRTNGTGQLTTGGHCCTYAVRIPASGVPYVPPAVEPQALLCVPWHARWSTDSRAWPRRGASTSWARSQAHCLRSRRTCSLSRTTWRRSSRRSRRARALRCQRPRVGCALVGELQGRLVSPRLQSQVGGTVVHL